VGVKYRIIPSTHKEESITGGKGMRGNRGSMVEQNKGVMKTTENALCRNTWEGEGKQKKGFAKKSILEALRGELAEARKGSEAGGEIPYYGTVTLSELGATGGKPTPEYSGSVQKKEGVRNKKVEREVERGLKGFGSKSSA